MSVSTPIPRTVELRRSRLIGLVAVVAVLAAGITWALLTFVVDSGSGSAQESATPAAVRSQLSPSEQRYVKGISALTRVQQAAAFGGPGGVLDALGLDPQDKRYVKGIASLTPAEQAAAFGR
jgi:hypothetical protein